MFRGIINTCLLAFQRLQSVSPESPDFLVADLAQQMTYNESIPFQSTMIPIEFYHPSLENNHALKILR